MSSFPPATQTALLSVLNTLRASKMDSLTVLVVGNNAVGKTALVSALLGERVIPAQNSNMGGMMGLMGMQMQQSGPNPKVRNDFNSLCCAIYMAKKFQNQDRLFS